jgi:putative tryptophan/tyrosine transport system substrate-binding protein
MKRRVFIAGLGAMGATLLAAAAQESSQMRRIGLLSGFPKNAPQTAASMVAFQEGLKAAGLEEGRNIQIDYRWAGIDPVATRTLAQELIALKPDVIVASTNQVVSIVMQETRSIPIVFVFIGDPIGSGYAATLAKPGKNLTGFANFEAPIGGK